MLTLIVLTTLLHFGFSEPPSYISQPFRPSQPYPLQDRIQSSVPAPVYGPPRPVYGTPNRPDDTTEPTTPPNNPRDVPSKFNNQKFQNIGQIQNLPQKDHRGTTIVFPSQQLSLQQFNQVAQQQLPGFNQNGVFRPQQQFQHFTATNSLQGQALPNPIQAYTFNENRASQLIRVPQSFQQVPFGSFNVEIQKSQQFQLRNSMPTQNPPSNFNFNNQNSINLQTPSLFNINAVPKQKTGRNNQLSQQGPANLKTNIKLSNNANSQVEFVERNTFTNDGVLAAKRASNPRKGGKVKAQPSRQYLTPVSTTPESVSPPTVRRRPSTTEATEVENNPRGRGPNVAISNSFAGRLFLLQPNGRLEPVILKRANPNDPDISDRNNISPAELMPFSKRVSSSIPRL